MAAWYDGALLAVDTETTGVDIEVSRVVTAACWFVNIPGGPRGFELLLNPGVEIPPEATEVHGVTTEKARDEGIDPTEGLATVLAIIDEAYRQGLPVVGYNLRFDLSLISRDAARHGLELPDGYPGLVVDPLVIDKWLDPYRKGSRSLVAQCERHSIQMDGSAHGATADAIAAARLAWRLAKSGEVKRRVRDANEGRELARLKREWEEVRGDLSRLHELQVRQAAIQAAGLEAYLRAGNPEKNVPPDPTAVVEREWPLIPLVESVDA